MVHYTQHRQIITKLILDNNMAKDTKYTSDDIEDLDDREHVRKRTQIYLGSMHPTVFSIPNLTTNDLTVQDMEFIPAAYKAINEVIDNCLDEFAQINIKNKTLQIEADPLNGHYVITDNGRGIPIDKKQDREGKLTWVPELALGRLRASRNFNSNKEIGVIGQNGVGASCTNFCSSQFDVTIHRDNKRYVQKFSNGASVISTPKVTSCVHNTGTSVAFTLDNEVFSTISLPDLLMQNRAIEIAVNNPDITVEYNGNRYRYKKGLHDLVEQIASNHNHFHFTLNSEMATGEFYVILDAHDDDDERIYTWVNSSLLFDGGKCNTQFSNALSSFVISALQARAKREKVKLEKSDIKSGLLILGSLKIKDPEYDSQSKTRLTGPDLRIDLVNMINTEWATSVPKVVKQWYDDIMQRANIRYHGTANRHAMDEFEKLRKRTAPIDGLLDATSKNRSECQVLITEGDSAKSQICEARNPVTTAAFALTGKIDNVYGCTPAQLLGMGKIKNLLSAIGLIPGKKAVRSDLNYGKIVVATDADYDGDDIFTLLVNLFYQFWPELVDPRYEPIVYRLITPNVCLVKGKQRLHFTRRSDYEKVKDKYKGYEVRYYKGLGSMHPDDWDMILSGQTDAYIPIVDDGKMRETFTLLFGPDSDARKEWLTVK